MSDIQTSEAEANTTGGGKGTMIGTIIVIIVLIIGAIYLFMGKAEAPANPEVPAGDETALTTDGSGASDEVADIEADLNVVAQDSDEQVNAIDEGLAQ